MSEPNQDNVRTVSGNIGTASGIDRDALLALADEMDNACPESASVAIGYIDDYALRIREACGVER